MDPALKDHLKQCMVKHGNLCSPKSQNVRISYGTAGFRGDANKIEHLFFNVGLIAGSRCLTLKANIGVMITASHNPAQDNGVKLIDPNGEMLEASWEPIVEEFCNSQSVDAQLELLEAEMGKTSLSTNHEPSLKVLLGYDTRPSSKHLLSLVEEGVQAWHPRVKGSSMGLMSTPALHYLVATSNHNSLNDLNIENYFKLLEQALISLFATKYDSRCRYSPDNLIVDCANGVGAETMNYLCNQNNLSKILPFKIINHGEGILNKLCGADFVKTYKRPPIGADDTSARYASLDGDADRIVYFYLQRSEHDEPELRLIDGDKILCLICKYLDEKLRGSSLDGELSLGVVQTAYANGASSDFLKNNLGIDPDCVETGVKNLQSRASIYDIAVYFEANGHGSIHVSSKARLKINKLADNVADAKDLKDLISTINNYTGDAVSMLIIAEHILRYYDWSIQDWHGLYDDRPNTLIGVDIPDRGAFKTLGQICQKPEGLQKLIDDTVGEFGSGSRCFVRPSGTEDIVRIYAEANSQCSAGKIANKVKFEILKLLNSSGRDQEHQ